MSSPSAAKAAPADKLSLPVMLSFVSATVSSAILRIGVPAPPSLWQGRA